ncbi:MAG: LysM peptidoglycan-binding domain-containing protein [Planctomycetes bacterium]|nr:LysM peptidoglycan-binding domain-containing protein [Planctomycetota bacterium]
MGQLEKYGLYVLCLVIFLILGVAIWGGGDVPPQGGRRAAADREAAALRGGTGSPSTTAGDGTVHAGSVAVLLGLDGGDKKPAAEGPKGAGDKVGGKPSIAEQLGGGAAPAGPKTGGEPVPAPPAPTARATHKVVSGDTFESIAKSLGSVSLVADIKRLNPTVEPSKMQLNTVLILPTQAEIEARRGGSSAKASTSGTSVDGTRKYIIAKGDTLEGIARRELGDPRRVGDLQQLNPGVEAKSLKIGRSLVLPAK